MLTQKQKDYLATIPEGRIVHIVPFDPDAPKTAYRVMLEIKSVLPSIEVNYLGSSKLSIAGENDIDLNILAGDDFHDVLPALTKLLGEPYKINLDEKVVKWNFIRDGFTVEIYFSEAITPFAKKGLDVQHILEKDKKLLKEYEQLKTQADGLPCREYVKRKWEFWDRILGIKE